MSLISVQDLTVTTAEGRDILAGIDLSVARGQRVGIVGESGSGKSTTASAILGLLPHGVAISSGSVRLDGTELVGLPEARLRRVRGKRISIVYQNPLNSLNPVVTVGRQISDVARSHLDVDEGEARRRAVALMSELGIPDAERRSADYPHQFSGGMAQRVAIAMALVCEPDLVIADEPTTGLDATIQQQVLRTIDRSIRGTGSALLLISHDLAVVSSMTDEVIVMRDGVIVEHGETARLMSEPAHAYTAQLVESARLADAPMTERRVSAEARRSPAVLTVDDVSKQFRVRGRTGRRVIRPVDGVSFSIGTRETVALVGESGSGKSTLARLIMGLHRPDGGAVALNGRPLSSLRGRRLRARRREIQMVFQNPLLSFDPMYSIGTSIREVLRLRPSSSRSPDAQVDELLDAVGLRTAFAGMRPRRMSGGELQRAAIARALAAEPSLVVLDEPTSALDVTIKNQVIALLQKLQSERDVSYLMTTHDLGVVRRISHRIIVLDHGRIVESAPTADLFADARHPYTRSLLAAAEGEVAPNEPWTDGDACSVDGGPCSGDGHEVQVAPRHFVRCWSPAGQDATADTQRKEATDGDRVGGLQR